MGRQVVAPRERRRLAGKLAIAQSLPAPAARVSMAAASDPAGAVRNRGGGAESRYPPGEVRLC